MSIDKQIKFSDIKPINTMRTNYSQAWQEYTATAEYQKMINILVDKGMRQPYIDNILNAAFAAGWNASGIKIEIIQTPTP